MALSLSPDQKGYVETRDALFASGNSRHRTFIPEYPFADALRASLLVTIKNPTDEDAILTDVVYDIKRVGGVRSSRPGPLSALATYNHGLFHSEGKQPQRLIPPFQILRGQAASLELELTSCSPGKGLGWFLRIGFKTSSKDIAYTEYFQLYLPERKAPCSNSQGVKTRNSISSDKPVLATEELINRSVSVNLPSPSRRNCVFEIAGITKSVEGLDALDKDMLFGRAGWFAMDEFIRATTETSPPIPYGQLLNKKQIRSLLEAE